MKLNKKLVLSGVLVLSCLAAVIIFLSCNLFYTDLSCYFGGLTFLSTLPAMMICFELVLLIIFFLRIYKHIDRAANYLRTYSIIGIAFSVIGIISDILACIILYDGNFFAPYPCNGYMIGTLIILLAFAVELIVDRIKYKNLEKVEFKVTPSHVFKTMFISFFIFYSLNRFGAVLCSIEYIHFRTLYMTFPFYILLLLPFSLFVYVLLRYFELIKGKGQVIYPIIVGALDIVLVTVCAIIAYNNTQFISAVSPAVPLERLATMPIETILLAIFVLAGCAKYIFHFYYDKKHQ